MDADANIIVGSTLDADMEGAMRVSVVATGIDALDVQADIPVPRRRLAEPLAAAQAALDAPAEAVAEPAAEPAILTAEDAAPAAVAAATSEEEPMLFDALDAESAAAAEQAEDIFEDDVPPPAYQPQVAAQVAQAPQSPIPEEAPADFVAPKPGTPTPETMARLQAAVDRAPRTATGEAPAPMRRAPAEPAAEKSRFGINSLIGRMTGQGEAAAPRTQPQINAPTKAAPKSPAKTVPPAAAKPPVQPGAEPSLSAPNPSEAEAEAEQDRIEIPAFLRRQAN